MTHLDLDRLAELEEDLLTPEDSATARSHLDECADCRALQARLDATRALVSTLPPDPMPAVVAARIDAALEALPSTTIVPLSSRRRGWRAHPTAAGLGAAAAIAALVSALVIGRTSSGPSSNAGDHGDAAGAASAARTAPIPLPTTTVSGTHYTSRNLAQSVSALLQPATPLAATAAGSTAAPQASSATPSPEPALTRLFTSPAALQACVRGIEGGPAVTPLAIDFATYQGAPAVLIVLPGLEAGNVDAWFVGANCTSSDPNLLRYRSLPAPDATPPSPGG